MARIIHNQDAIEKAVKRYMAGEQVTALAKELKVSVPGFYLWIKKAKEAAAETARKRSMSPATITAEERIAAVMTARELKQENERLKKALFNLMLETGKL